jgi:hypothetical protein
MLRKHCDDLCEYGKYDVTVGLSGASINNFDCERNFKMAIAMPGDNSNSRVEIISAFLKLSTVDGRRFSRLNPPDWAPAWFISGLRAYVHDLFEFEIPSHKEIATINAATAARTEVELKAEHDRINADTTKREAELMGRAGGNIVAADGTATPLPAGHLLTLEMLEHIVLGAPGKPAGSRATHRWNVHAMADQLRLRQTMAQLAARPPALEAALLTQGLLRAEKLFPLGGSMSELAVLFERVLRLEAAAAAQ